MLKLLAVTKGKSLEQIKQMLKKTGVTRIAENRLAEAEEKIPSLDPKLEKHFIGKLQSRKIPKIVELFHVIQSLENLKQAKLISKQAKDIDVMIQVNISGLENRSGINKEGFSKLKEEVLALPHINLIGVMGIASPDPIKAKKEFKILKSLQGDLAECSMGMSEDFEIALQEGSTMLRLGRILFKEPLPNLPKFE